MKELGDWSIELHHRVGQTVKALGIDQLLILADPDESQALATGAAGIPSQCCESKSELLAILEQSIMSGDRILFKASRSVGLDEIVEQLRIKD
ncbi:MAG: hypothetical protein F6K29_34855 [Okeania sp. SIO2G5]|nr:hypothetical protein [Okeania sp. SIO2G5]